VSFKYYLYVSDAKIDMILSQLEPSFRRRRTFEWSFDLKIFAARRESETALGENRFARLETVVRFLQDHGDLGSVDEPGQFFGGLLPMKWGPLEDPSIFYFGGSTDQTILGLVGSAAHVVGADLSHSPERPRGLLGYALPPLAEALREDRDGGEVPPRPAAESPDQGVLNAVDHATATFPGPTQNVEFIAKRLLRGRSLVPDGRDHVRSEKSVLLGTPLYVASVD
jgi:hypothetical protein